jgi:hypothetical protein
MPAHCRRYRVRRHDIAFLRFILEGYDGLAVLTTVDPRQGTVRLTAATGGEVELEGVLQALRREYGMPIDPLDPPEAGALTVTNGAPCS